MFAPAKHALYIYGVSELEPHQHGHRRIACAVPSLGFDDLINFNRDVFIGELCTLFLIARRTHALHASAPTFPRIIQTQH